MAEKFTFSKDYFGRVPPKGTDDYKEHMRMLDYMVRTCDATCTPGRMTITARHSGSEHDDTVTDPASQEQRELFMAQLFDSSADWVQFYETMQKG